MRHRVIRLPVTLIAVLLLTAACGSGSSSKSGPPTSPATGTSLPAGTTSPSAPITTTTVPLDPKVADQFTQNVLAAALDAAKSIYSHSYDYTTVTPAALGPLLPSVTFAPIDQASRHAVGVLAQDRNDVLLVLGSLSGRWYCITENTMDGVTYGEGLQRDAVDSKGQCRRPAWPPPGTSQSGF